MKYKAILFDMDGTVLNTLDDLAASVNASLAAFNLPQVSTEQVRAALGNGAQQLIDRCAPAGMKPSEKQALLDFYLQYYSLHCKDKTAPYEGVITLLEGLRAKGARLAIISNKQDSAVKDLAAEFFPGLLETAVGESETVRRKPNADAVLDAAKLLDAQLSDCVYIGDSEVDVQTAINAGMDCIAVTWGFRSAAELKDAGAEKIANSLEQLSEYLF